jgi:hypothetical protein
MQPRALIDSPLSQTVESGSLSFDICIYRLEHTDWSLSIVGPNRAMITWDQPFRSDQTALSEALSFLDREGVDTFVNAARPAFTAEHD